MAFNRVDAQQVAVSCGFNSWDEIKRKINDAAGVSVPSQQESTILRACYGRDFALSPSSLFSLARTIEVDGKPLVLNGSVKLDGLGRRAFFVLSDGQHITPTSVMSTYACPNCDSCYTTDMNPSRGLARDCVLCRACSKRILHRCRSYREKFESSMLATHGVRRPLQDRVVLEKMQRTMIERHGAKTSGESSIITSKRDSTMLARYGRKNYFTGINPWYEFSFHERDVYRHQTSRGERELATALTSHPTLAGLLVYSCVTRRYVHNSTVKHACFMPDVYVPAAHIVVEYHGDHWHGNPLLYSHDHVLYGGMTREQINARDADRVAVLESELRCQVHVVWESEWRADSVTALERIVRIIDEAIHSSPSDA